MELPPDPGSAPKLPAHVIFAYLVRLMHEHGDKLDAHIETAHVWRDRTEAEWQDWESSRRRYDRANIMVNVLTSIAFFSGAGIGALASEYWWRIVGWFHGLL